MDDDADPLFAPRQNVSMANSKSPLKTGRGPALCNIVTPRYPTSQHPAQELLRQIPQLGPIRVALLIALVQTPHRFRTKRQLWAYCGLAAPFTETFQILVLYLPLA